VFDVKWFVCIDINIGEINSSNTQEHGARRDQTAAKQDLGRYLDLKWKKKKKRKKS
jgi:hypothetical protein